ncbi:vacuolar calcium ion transporter [Fusarium beomiforme]|uniref:Vacuolar calcium ion transporter n=1 Tax=Fusarium beomiforme TaxID=44412 RepID=A0A9P5AUN3_9HYPO|nr:vacuolar calcium ion transporter [Fusarium beomiforme]
MNPLPTSIHSDDGISDSTASDDYEPDIVNASHTASTTGTRVVESPIDRFFWNKVLPSFGAMFLSSWLNVLLIFVIAGIGTHVADASPLLVFTCNAIAIVPLSALLTDATEVIAAKSGDTIGALMNITFGNLVELILLIALKNNQIYVVQASILGSILVNLLLILGSALVASNLACGELTFNTGDAQLLACLLFVSIFVVLMPTAFAQTFSNVDKNQTTALKMSRVSAFMVLFIYILYFVHEMKSRANKANVLDVEIPDIEVASVYSISQPSQSLDHGSTSLGSQILPPRTIRFTEDCNRQPRSESIYKLNDASELETMEPNEADEMTVDRGRHSRESNRNSYSRPGNYQPLLGSRRRSRSFSISSGRAFRSRESSMSGDGRHPLPISRGHHEASEADLKASVAMLITTSVLMSVCGEFLVNKIDDITHDGGLSEALIGLVILPIVGNVAEYATVVAVAIRGNLGLAIAVSVGSSIQIALCISPLTVLAGWAMNRDLDLTFNMFEMMTLVGAVLLVNLLVLTDGSTNLGTSGLKGALILGAFLAPQSSTGN